MLDKLNKKTSENNDKKLQQFLTKTQDYRKDCGLTAKRRCNKIVCNKSARNISATRFELDYKQGDYGDIKHQ